MSSAVMRHIRQSMQYVLFIAHHPGRSKCGCLRFQNKTLKLKVHLADLHKLILAHLGPLLGTHDVFVVLISISQKTYKQGLFTSCNTTQDGK